MKAIVKIVEETNLKEMQEVCFSKGFGWKIGGNKHIFYTFNKLPAYFILNENVMTWTSYKEKKYNDFQYFDDVKTFIRKVKIDNINDGKHNCVS